MKYYNMIMFLLYFMYYHDYLFATKYHKQLIELIEDRTIIFEGKIGSLKLFFEEYPNITQIDTFISMFPQIAYTALKCKYADYIIDLLQTFYCVLEQGYQAMDSDYFKNLTDKKPWTVWLSTSIAKLIESKKLVEKMIFNLFYYSDNNPKLRTSDPNLLKSLLTLNLFLYYSNTISYIDYNPLMNTTDLEQHILKKSIIIINNGIEQFRCKHCLIRDPYKIIIRNSKYLEYDPKNLLINNTDNIMNVLSTPLDNIRKIIDLTLLHNNTNYIDDMYDHESILLKNLLEPGASLLGHVEVLIKDEKSKLLTIFKTVAEKYDIKRILEFQKMLISIIIDVYIRQIHLSLNLITKDLTYYYIYLSDLDFSFNDFLSKLNLSIGLIYNYSDIIETKSYLTELYQNGYDVHDKAILSSLAEKFEKLITNEYIYSDDQQTIARSKSLFSLVNKILYYDIFKPFIQIVNLLSYKTYSNSDFYVDNPNNLYITLSAPLLDILDNLRNSLFAFMILIKPSDTEGNFNNVIRRSDTIFIGQSSTSANSISTEVQTDFIKLDISIENKVIIDHLNITRHIMFTVLDYFKEFEHYFMDVKYIILPLLIRLKHSVQLTNKFDLFEVLSLFQIAFLTNSLLETHILREHIVRKNKLNLFIFLCLNPNYKSQCFEDLKKNFVKDVEISTIISHLDDLNNMYSENMHTDILPEKDNQIKFHWNMSHKFVFDIVNELSLGIIDFSDLIGYQWFVIKFFVAKILIEFKFIVKDVEDKKHNTQFNKDIVNELNKLQNLNLPNTIRSFLDNTIKATYDIFVKNIIKTENCTNAQRHIIKGLKSLGVDSINKSYRTILDISSLRDTIHSFDLLLNGYLEETRYLFLLEDLSLSAVHSDIDDEPEISPDHNKTSI